jgi:hypothetical protein
MCPVGRGKASRAEKAFKVIPGLRCTCASNWLFVSMEKKPIALRKFPFKLP